MDLFADPTRRDPVSAFVQLLWERGNAYEKEVISRLTVPFLDLSAHFGDERERLTLEAMRRGESLIYAGRISADDLLGDPDLLRREGGGYVAGDIKSGSGQEGPDDEAKLKKHYAVQLALYTDILERKGFAASRRPFVWDVHGEEVIYDLDAPQGAQTPTTLWQIYEDALAQARQIISKHTTSLPAYSAVCKLCHWYSACVADLEAGDDLTLLPELGRAKRDAMASSIPNVAALATSDITRFIEGKKTAFAGIGPDTLLKLQQRAKLVKAPNPRPCRTSAISLSPKATEIFFDVEVDPMHDFCYLHGFIERRNGDNAEENYHGFFAGTVKPEEEERAFAEAWCFIVQRQPCTIYYYSKYERTIWRKLQEKYPAVCRSADIEALFNPIQSVDLYFDVVKKATEWPTRDYSIKTLATYLGFTWRDRHPSGAASIEWFNRWIETSDPEIKKRILEYNEDDCRATRILLDAVRSL